MFTIENEYLRIIVRSKGAELSSIFHKKNNIEYIWQADPAFWAKQSPVLFPIVGTLKNNSYHFENSDFKLPRHGFARDQDYVLIQENKTTLRFSLADTQETFEAYPFHFRFDITYKIESSRLKVTYSVFNTGGKNMYFSVGGHPAFRVPLTGDASYEDYYLQFDYAETSNRWPISADGLIEQQSIPALEQADRLPITRELFAKDALVFKDLRSEKVSLLSKKNNHGLEVDFPGFPYLGIWAAKGADFVCIEPWCGIADSVNAPGQLKEKEGINMLPPGEVFERTWSVRVF